MSRFMLIGLGMLGVAEMVYVGVAPSRIDARLRELGDESNVEVTIDRVRSWYPGNLELDHVRLKTPHASARLERVEGRFSVVAWLGGESRLEGLVIDGLSVRYDAPEWPMLELEGRGSRLLLARLARRQASIDFGVARLHVDAARLRVDDEVVLSGLEGEFAMSWDEERSGAFGGLTVEADLSSERARAPVPSPAATRVLSIDREGTFEAHIELSAGRLDSESRLVFELPSVEPTARSGKHAVPQGLWLGLQVSRASNQVVVSLTTPKYEGPVHRAMEELRDVELTLTLPTSGALDPLAGGATLRGSVGKARVRIGELSVEGSLELSANIAPGSTATSLELASGTLAFDDLYVEPPAHGERRGPAKGSVELEYAGFEAASLVRFDGRFRASGTDARAMFELASAPEPPSWVIEKFEGQPFSLEGAVRRDASGLALQGIQLQRGAITLRGWLRLFDGKRYAAFELDYGLLSLGMRLDGTRSELVPSPSPGWLNATRRQCFDRSVSGCNIAVAKSR